MYLLSNQQALAFRSPFSVPFEAGCRHKTAYDRRTARRRPRSMMKSSRRSNSERMEASSLQTFKQLYLLSAFAFTHGVLVPPVTFNMELRLAKTKNPAWFFHLDFVHLQYSVTLSKQWLLELTISYGRRQSSGYMPRVGIRIFSSVEGATNRFTSFLPEKKMVTAQQA